MPTNDKDLARQDRLTEYAALALMGMTLVVLSLAGRTNYLLFHFLAEGFAISVSLWVYIIGWHSRHTQRNGYLAFVGIAYLFVAILDTLHTLSYKGTGVFPGYDADLPTKLWVAARYLQSLSLLAAPLFLGRRLRYNATLAVFAALTALLLWSIFTPGVFPTCFVEGRGLTAFKVASEYVISAIFLAGIGILVARRRDFDEGVLRWLVLSLALTVLSELAFTQYASVYGGANMAGHLLRIVALFFMYKAIVETGLTRPFNLLFRELKKSEESLRADNEKMRQLQLELADRNRELQKANDLKNEFLGTAVHDLRSPLTVVTWYSEYLLEEDHGHFLPQQRNYLEAIQRSAGYMASLVDDLLDIAQIESGKLKLSPAPTDLDGFLEGVVGVNRPLAAKKGIVLIYEGAAGVPAVMADPHRLEQALTNLIGNAVKFSRPGDTVTVRLAREAAATVSVCDQGPGIPPEELEKVFKPFEKGPSKPTTGEKSTGLGLAIARKIIEEHGGDISVASLVGRGSCFYVRLPFADRDGSRAG